MKNQVIRAAQVVLLMCFSLQIKAFTGPAVTYQLSGGRFGDNVLSYMHAKWVSYLYGVPLLYKKFPCSDQLVLHDKELALEVYKHRFKKHELIDRLTPLCIDKKSDTLYILAYCPESIYECAYFYIAGTDKLWMYIPINWEDVQFKQLLRSLVKPRNKLNQEIQIPSDQISVALHIRRGGSFEKFDVMKKLFPLKFPNNDYYEKALRALDCLLEHRKLLVYLFTDDCEPRDILKEFEGKFIGASNISFSCKQGVCGHNINVVEDFFSLTFFDCIIMPYSNFPLCASKLGNYAIKILPKAGCLVEDVFVITDLDVAVNNEKLVQVLSRVSG